MLFLLQTETVLKQVENVGSLLGAIGLIISMLIAALVWMAKREKHWQDKFIKLAIETTALVKTVDEKLSNNEKVHDEIGKIRELIVTTTNVHGKNLETIKILVEQLGRKS